MASAAQRRIKSISYAKYGYMFILPFFLVYLFFQLWPLINTFKLSFYGNDTETGKFVGLDNYKIILFNTDYDEDIIVNKRKAEAIKDLPKEEQTAAIKEEQANLGFDEQHETFFQSLRNTVILWVGNFIPQIILSLSLAVWFTDAKLKIPGKGFFKVVMYMPNIITAASVAVLFLSLCQENEFGALRQIMKSMGVIDDVRTTKASAMYITGIWPPRFVVMFIQTWLWFGNTMIMLMSGIMGINPSLFEAASIDGASSGQVFRKITLPLLSPIMVYTLVTSMIGGLQMFDIPFMFHNGQFPNKHLRTVAVYIYESFKNRPNEDYMYGYSGAASVILFIITAALGSITFYLNRDTDAIAKRKQRKKLAKQAKMQSKQFGGLSI
jgi:multiple sugar transport system permease protein